MIYPAYKNRLSKRAKLTNIELDFIEKISFEDIKKVTPNKIISLFSNWFINKHEEPKMPE